MTRKSLGRYEIIEPLGKGGMGEVYAAEDTTLRRRVALKLLPPELASDQDRQRRFRREAETVAALDHPNIVVIHSLEETDGIPFITMQLVEGETLAAMVGPAGFPVDRLLDLAIPLADALCAAHEHGVVHRDLKPSNVMVGNDGRVRILDFGLAKLIQEGVGAGAESGTSDAAAGAEDQSETATRAETEGLTVDGTVVGTVPYMSPEQLQAQAVDQRTDLFSFGAILYEMATGRPPFDGESPAEIISSILRDVPDSITEHRAELPPRLGRIVGHCLEKDPARRYQTAHDLRHDLEELRDDTASRATRAATGAASDAGSDWADLPLPDKPSLAVLPFENVSGDPEQEYFAWGLTADLMTELVKLAGLFLVSQTTMVTYRGKQVTPQQVARELGVRHVLQGTVRRSSDRVRITAELVHAQSGKCVWAERYDGELDDLFTVQDEINEEIVTNLDVKLVFGEAARIFRQSLRNPQARDYYYRGTDALYSFSEEGMEEARRLFEEVIGLEPGSPWGYMQVAWTHYFMATQGWTDDPGASFERAEELAEKALALGDTTGMARMLIAQRLLMHRKHEDALMESEQVLRDRPSCPWAYAQKANINNYAGYPEDAVSLAKLSIRLTPLSPTWYPAVLAAAYYLQGRHEEAIGAARQALRLAPENVDARLMLAAAAAASGDTTKAAAAAERIRRLQPDFDLSRFAETQPYRDTEDLEGFVADLRQAGLESDPDGG